MNKAGFVFALLLIMYYVGFSQIISTVAGNNSFGRGFSGDGGPATLAELSAPLGIIFDSSGNFYFADDQNWIIRKVDNTGIISTFAGNYYYGIGYSGDGGPATSAELSLIDGICKDKFENLYLACGDEVREVNISSGIINTVAGNHLLGSGYSGDGGPATNAEIFNVGGVSLDSSGKLYIVDSGNNIIRMVIVSTGIISTVAGNYALGAGYSGDGGPATSAQLRNPEEICTDKIGNIYIADIVNHLIRMVNNIGVISTFAGNYSFGYGYTGDGGPATLAELYYPRGLAFDTLGNLFFADIGDNVIREVNTSGIITTVAGNYSFGAGYSGDGGLASNAELNAPNAVTFDKEGNLYISDGHNYVVRKVSGMLTGANKVREKYCGVRVYPNPTSGRATLAISYELSANCQIEVFNVFGQLVYSSYKLSAMSYELDLSGQPNGVYLYRVIKMDEVASPSLAMTVGTGKIVIEK